MSAVFICDGCKTSVDNPEKVGHILKRDYCPDCAAKAQQYVDAEEALRKRLTDSFRADRELLVASMSAGNFKLPDVP